MSDPFQLFDLWHSKLYCFLEYPQFSPYTDIGISVRAVVSDPICDHSVCGRRNFSHISEKRHSTLITTFYDGRFSWRTMVRTPFPGPPFPVYPCDLIILSLPISVECSVIPNGLTWLDVPRIPHRSTSVLKAGLNRTLTFLRSRPLTPDDNVVFEPQHRFWLSQGSGCRGVISLLSLRIPSWKTILTVHTRHWKGESEGVTMNTGKFVQWHDPLFTGLKRVYKPVTEVRLVWCLVDSFVRWSSLDH